MATSELSPCEGSGGLRRGVPGAASADHFVAMSGMRKPEASPFGRLAAPRRVALPRSHQPTDCAFKAAFVDTGRTTNFGNRVTDIDARERGERYVQMPTTGEALRALSGIVRHSGSEKRMRGSSRGHEVEFLEMSTPEATKPHNVQLSCAGAI